MKRYVKLSVTADTRQLVKVEASKRGLHMSEYVKKLVQKDAHKEEDDLKRRANYGFF